MYIPRYSVNFRGHVACPCLAQWIPHYEAELRRRGILGDDEEITIYRLIGYTDSIAGLHSRGGTFDFAPIGDGHRAVYVARQMGADATWCLPDDWDGKGGVTHIHGVLRGCPHNSPSVHQIHAVDAGYNGFGRAGRGGKDTGPRPLSRRTWRQGINWAKEKRTASKVSSLKERLRETLAVALSSRRETKRRRTL